MQIVNTHKSTRNNNACAYYVFQCGRFRTSTRVIEKLENQKIEIQKFEGNSSTIFILAMSNSEEQDCNSSDDEDLMDFLFLHHVANDTTFSPAENKAEETKVDSQAIKLGRAFEKAAS